MHDIADLGLTRFDYLYRDASNYKAHGHILLEGGLSTEDHANFIDRLEGGEFFIAEQIGIPPLYECLYEDGCGPSNQDHCWHEFVRLSVVPVATNEGKIWGTTAELVNKIRSVVSWNAQLSPHLSTI